jgi:hypothetical protein
VNTLPRQSKAALTLAHVGPRRLEPPPELGEGSIEREIFCQVVASVPPAHFQPEDVTLLAAYARSAALERRSAEELQVCVVAGGSPSPWLAVHATAVRSLSTMAVRLRLGPKARQPDRRRMARPASQPSYYQLMEREPR